MRDISRLRAAPVASGLLALLLSSCSTGETPTQRSAPEPSPSVSSPAESRSSGSPSAAVDLAGDPYTGWPDSVAVLGHSGATGEGSAGASGADAKANSWATGTNPEVDSVYRRILRKNPVIEGNASNFAEGGADLAMIIAQAERAVAADPKPELVLVQAVDNDLSCLTGASDDSYLDGFDQLLTELLTLLSSELPQARVFLTIQDPAGPTYEAAGLSRQERRQLGANGPCEMFDPEGRVVQREVRRLRDSIQQYVDRLAEVCERFGRCYHDPGVFKAYPQPRPEWLTPDLNHLSVAGLANAAEVAWSGLRRQGLVPAD